MKDLRNVIASNLNTYITEKLILNKSNTKQECHYHPKTKIELKELLKQLINDRGNDADLNDIDTSAITDMSLLFTSISPHDIDISEWDVSNVKDMQNMFTGCKNFNSDLSSWDVSNVENMYCMFAGCQKFNSDLSSWNVSNVEDMKNMFLRCKNFDSDLSSWDISNVKTMYRMFAGCDSLKKLPKWFKGSINEKLILNKSTKQEYEHTYHYHPTTKVELKELCKKLLEERGKDADLNDIDTSAITDMSWLFDGLNPHEIDISEWDVSNVKDMSGMFAVCKNFNCDISNWNVSNVKNMYGMFYRCNQFNSDLSNWDVSNAKDMGYMFDGCDSSPKWFKGSINEKLILNKSTKYEHTYNYHPIKKAELIDLLKKLLNERGNDADLNDIDTSAITDMSWLFDGLDPHEIDISEWDVSNVKNMAGMFAVCNNFNSDLSNWNVSNVENMFCMFYKCQNFNSDLSGWDVSCVIKMERTFYECKNFNCDISNWNVSNVDNMYGMFYRCNQFNSDLSNWDVSNVKDMEYMFDGCDSLKKSPKWFKGSINEKLILNKSTSIQQNNDFDQNIESLKQLHEIILDYFTDNYPGSKVSDISTEETKWKFQKGSAAGGIKVSNHFTVKIPNKNGKVYLKLQFTEWNGYFLMQLVILDKHGKWNSTRIHGMSIYNKFEVGKNFLEFLKRLDKFTKENHPIEKNERLIELFRNILEE